MDISSTPLDLLLNAIGKENVQHGDRGDEIGVEQEDLFESPVYDFSDAGEGSLNRRQQSLDQLKDEQIRRAITQLVLDGANASSLTSSRGKTSSIQVWHPTAAQKSYNKERRLIAPPPFVRISGPILNSISTLTLSSVPIPVNAETAAASSSQTHRILAPGANSDDLPRVLKKQGRDQRGRPKPQVGRNLPLSLSSKSEVQFDKNREMLGEGVTFPGLWIGGGDAEAKIKGFELVLDISAGVETVLPAPESGSVDLGLAGTSLNGVDQSLADATVSTTPSGPAIPAPWAKLSSSPISIVTKPSIKTAKSRSFVSCLSEASAFALWVRIHAQAVRTKYMKLDDNTANARLTSRTGQWTPFTFEIIHRAILASEHITMQKAVGEEARRVMTYGSIVRLIDTKSGTKSEAVKLVKVEKNEVVIGIINEEGEEVDTLGSGDGQPISELQKIGMVRINDQGEEVLEDGKRSYLSAPGARLGGGELVDPGSQKWIWVGRGRRVPTKPKSTVFSTPTPGPSTPVPQTLDDLGVGDMAEDIATAFGISEPEIAEDTVIPPVMESLPETQEEKADVDDGERPAKRIKTKRHALAQAAVAEDEDVEQIVCTWSVADRRISEKEEKEGKVTVKKQVKVEIVEDWMAWVIGGVESFTHTFTDTESLSADPLPNPKSLTPAPRLLVDPIFNTTNNTLQLTLSSFFSLPTPLSRPVPLSVYLGPIGPLQATTWQSTWRSTSVKHPTRGPAVPCIAFDGDDAFHPDPSGDEESVMSNFPAMEEHVIVLVRLPRPSETLRIMQILQVQATVNPTEHNPSTDIPSGNAIAGPSTVDDPPAWLDVVPGFDPTEIIDGNEAIRQALQSVSQATEEEAEFSNSLSRLDGSGVLGDGGGGEINIDPALQSGSGSKLRVQVAKRDQPQQRQMDEQASFGSEMIPLPIFLVRRESEMVFGLGKSMIAEKRAEGGDDWGLRVISS